MSDQRKDRSGGASRAPTPGGMELSAGEVADLARHDPRRLAESLGAFSTEAQADLALRLPARQRLELLLHSPKPMQLVRALPDSELYLTLRDLGPADALPLLALSSASQLQHLLDLECWRKDRFDGARLGAWVALLVEAGEPTLRRLLRNADDELLALLFRDWARIEPIEHDENQALGQGQTETGDERGQVSPDGNYRLNTANAEHLPAAARIAQLFNRDQPARYQAILWRALYELPAELEEQALRWRQSRLEEHGFVPWEEALAVYAPPSGKPQARPPVETLEPSASAAPRLPLRLLPERSPLAVALDGLPAEARERGLAELVAVANRLLVADGADTGDPANHLEALARGVGAVSVALAARGADDPERMRQLLTELPVLELFREGHAKAVALQERARGLVREGWAAAHPQALQLLDSPLRERLAALLEPRPLYVELGADRPRLRGFRSLGELDETRAAVDLAELVGRTLVHHLGLDVGRALGWGDPAASEPVRFATWLLTALAWHAVRGEVRLDPLPGDVVAAFLRAVASRRTAAPDAAARALESMVSALRREFALERREAALLLAFGRSCLEQLAADCGSLDPGVPLDPGRVRSLRIAP